MQINHLGQQETVHWRCNIEGSVFYEKKDVEAIRLILAENFHWILKMMLVQQVY